MDSGTIELTKKTSKILGQSFYWCQFTGNCWMENGMWAISVCEKNKLEVRPAIIWEILKKQEEKLAKTED